MTAATGHPDDGPPGGVAVAVDLAVRGLLARYCHRCDDGDFEGVAELFVPDGAFVYGERTVRGQAELVEFLRGTQGAPQQRGRHLVVNSALEPAGERVRGVADFVFLRVEDGQLIPAIVGRYHDEFVRSPAGWRFARREVRVWERPTEDVVNGSGALPMTGGVR